MSWVAHVNDLRSEDVTFALVGNKIDLSKDRQVSYQEGKDLGSSKGYVFQEVSAKTGENIQQFFLEDIYKVISKKLNIKLKETPDSKHERNIQISKEPKKKKGCCGKSK